MNRDEARALAISHVLTYLAGPRAWASQSEQERWTSTARLDAARALAALSQEAGTLLSEVIPLDTDTALELLSAHGVGQWRRCEPLTDTPTVRARLGEEMAEHRAHGYRDAARDTWSGERLDPSLRAARAVRLASQDAARLCAVYLRGGHLGQAQIAAAAAHLLAREHAEALAPQAAVMTGDRG